MKTSFSEQTILLLADDAARAIAILICEPGKNIDITERVETALKEYTGDTCEVISDEDDTFFDFTEDMEVHVKTADEDDEEFSDEYRLSIIQNY